MIPSNPSRRSVEVFANVVVAAPAGRLLLKGDGTSVSVSGHSWSVYRDLLSLIRRRSRSERRGLLTRFGRGLHAAGLELSFTMDDREIARMDGSDTGWVARGLALPGVRIRYVNLAASLIRSRRAARLDA